MQLSTPGPRAAFPPASVVAELFEAVLVDPEIVRQLVENGDPDLLLELGRIVAELLDQRHAVDRDLVGHVLGRLPEPEQVGVLGVLVLDDDRHVLEAPGDLRWEPVESAADVLLEPHQLGLRGRRVANARTRRKPKTKPPTCAKNATPPPASGRGIDDPPAHSRNPNQNPRKNP